MILARCSGEGNGNEPKTGTPAGTYEVKVQGESGDLTASTTVKLVVRGAVAP